MQTDPWIEWIRTTLSPRERDALLAGLTPEQRERLHERDYVWVSGVGVLWIPVDGGLRRARFTHGTHFRTRHGEFFIDSAGHARELAVPDGAKQEEAA